MKFDDCKNRTKPFARFWRHTFSSMLLLMLFVSGTSSAADDVVKLNLLLGDVSMNKLPFVLAFD